MIWMLNLTPGPEIAQIEIPSASPCVFRNSRTVDYTALDSVLFVILIWSRCCTVFRSA